MKSVRRSLKGSIGAPTPTFSSLSTASFPSLGGNKSNGSNTPVNRPLASPAPPKRVIRATEAYRARTAQELSFEEGDFFHVVSEDGGEDWYDAANPMTGARGLVPARSFQVLGRNVRETPQQAPQGQSSNGGQGYAGAPPAQAGSSYGQKGSSYIPTSSNPVQSSFSQPPLSPPLTNASAHYSTSSGGNENARSSRPPSQPAPKSQPLYGIVQYDFVAERADELDAKRGEPIIVIAQSNHEWFVAKPIGRLGGPGLIPVAFVEIQDMTTGKPVENVEELIRSAVVPKVEEWKKMTADYKSASIPLGRFEFAEGSQTARMSQGTTTTPYQPPTSVSPLPQLPESSRSDTSQYDTSEQQYNEQPYDDNRPYSYTRERRQYGLVTSASVESFHQEEGSFWFHLRANFSTGASLILYRLYQDFYDFQIALMDEFPVEAGRRPIGGDEGARIPERILPMMPGPTDFENEVVCAQRVHDLSIYLADLCALPDPIRRSGLMYEFLVPRAGDVEVEAGNGMGDTESGGAASIEGQYGELVQYLDQMDGSAADDRGVRDLAGKMNDLDVGPRGEEGREAFAGESHGGQQQNGRKSQSPSRYSSNSNSNRQYSPTAADGESQLPLIRKEDSMTDLVVIPQTNIRVHHPSSRTRRPTPLPSPRQHRSHPRSSPRYQHQRAPTRLSTSPL